MKPDFEPIDWDLSFIDPVNGTFFGALNGKRFRLNNGKSLEDVVFIYTENYSRVCYLYEYNTISGNTGWCDTMDYLLGVTGVEEELVYEFKDGFDGPKFTALTMKQG